MINQNIITTESASSEHILVCLSASPSNARIIVAAAKMAEAFKGSFTALYVQKSDTDKLNETDRKRLENNIKLAESLGANITTVYGEDISYQISEFARLSDVTKIVIGSSNATRRHFWSKPTLTEKLTEIVPNIDIHIIPDAYIPSKNTDKTFSFFHNFIPYPKDLLITLLIFTIITLICFLFSYLGFTEVNIITIYILGVLLTSLFTRGYTCCIIASVLSVASANFFFTEPRFTFHAYDPTYPITFAIMLASAVITGTLASKLKSQARLSAQAAFRTKILLDTNQLLQKAVDDKDIINIAASQITKLIDRSVIIYSIKDNRLTKGYIYPSSSEPVEKSLLSDEEYRKAEDLYRKNLENSSPNNILTTNEYLYMCIHINGRIYGVMGIHTGEKPLESFESNILLSVLGECALALDNSRNAKEKEFAAVVAKNEQLRANLLRAISHDLRTPLTSISGNSATLLANYDKLDEETRVRIFTDIYDDSQWLISIVENLLSVTRIEEGRMNFNLSVHLIEEVIDEALKHINRKSTEHNISVSYKEDLLLAKIDAKLIIQVIINLVDNAIKYTPERSDIIITAEKAEPFILISIADNGNGIPDNLKSKVFEMFYTGNNKIADSCRSLGLGLPVCKSIINAHGGEITLNDNIPHGCIFRFTVPSSEVVLYE